MNTDLTALKIYSFHNNRYSTKPPMRIHRHNTVEIYYVDEGCAYINYFPHNKTEYETFTLQSKQFAVFRPNVRHSINSDCSRLAVYNLEIMAKNESLDLFRYIDSHSYVNRFPVARNLLDKWNDVLLFTDTRNMAHILNLFKRPVLSNAEDPYHEAELEIALKRLFIEILACAPERLSVSGQNLYIKKAVRFIAGNFNRNISVESIAENINISVCHLERIFNAHFKTSVKQYLNTFRIEQAKGLIVDTNLPIAQIIKNSGFQNAQSFNNNFKRITGVSPLKYRNIENKKNIKYRDIL